MDYVVYFLLLMVLECQARQFKAWEPWSTCSTTCGAGEQGRKRECSNGTCVQREKRGCQISPCPGGGGGGGGVSNGAKFKAWEEWGRCSQTCGQGVQERKRLCANRRCKETARKTCQIRSCSGDDSAEWSEWTGCSATCGHGAATRTRQCPVGNCKQKQTKTCYLKTCPAGAGQNPTYEPWGDWSSCSATCGRGKRTRIRQCKELECRETEVDLCTIKQCPEQPDIVHGEWETWGACSATCGHGRKKRKRTCVVGICEQTQAANCKVSDCPNGVVREYKEWEAWGPCSTTCGVGEYKRRRKCVVGLCVEVMRKTCFAPTCPGGASDHDFLPWAQWGTCSVTCGRGERKRTRNCQPPAKCVETQTQSCFPRPCGSTGGPPTSTGDRFHDWEDWSPCSVSCGTGKETRTRRCRVGNCVEEAKRSCRLKSCFADPVTEYGLWAQWSKCSATCGAGEAKRTRSFLDGSNFQEQLKYCNNKRCKTTEDQNKYRQWSGCSVSCGTGLQTRVRLCKVGSCRDTETKSCKVKDCMRHDLDAKYGPWRPWGECSKTCGFGFTFRKRYCKIGVCEQTASKTCRLEACPTDYTEWEEWGRCSVTCGSGVSTRKRYCTVGSCEEKQQTTCDVEKCGTGWEDWAEWQGCHKSCGGGFDNRIRRCKEQLPSDICPGDNYDYRRCNTHSCDDKGVWGSWSEWGDCTFTCGAGESVRIRVCEEGQCEGDDKETKPCNTEICVQAHWSDWSEWGKCSVTCDEGERTRSRTCIGGKQWDEGCLGSLLTIEMCAGPPCQKAKWSKWTQWRPCSVTCGRGKRNRERVCINGVAGDRGCTGQSSGAKVCKRPACVTAKWGEWTDWKACSETCSEGVTLRTRPCYGGTKGDPGCTGDDEERKACNIKPCPDELVGTWTEWSDWSACNSTCGFGTLLRKRTCQGNGSGCPGRGQEVNKCTQEDCIAPVWLTWSEWSDCTVTCDSGTQSRSRECTEMDACSGEAEEVRDCNTQECTTATPTEASEGRWSVWQRWGNCPVPCGSGISHRTRSCIGGTVGKGSCQGRRTQHRRCKKRDCHWSTWEGYSDCSVTCGKGTKRRSRKCAEGTTAVTKCLGSSIYVAECEEEECPFDPDISCPEIPKPSNGDVIETSDPPHKIGEELTFVCDVGYLARGETTIRCQQDGRWSGPAPYCAAKSCTRDLLRVAAGQTCLEACESDDDCPGTSTQCLCDGWCGKSCLDPDAECETLSLPENGYIIGRVRTFGYTVTYGCNDGFILVGTSTRTCRSDGRWTGLGARCHSYHTPGIAGDEGNIFGESVERVVKGSDARIAAWPWQALIMLNETGYVSEAIQSMIAGGTVINQNWILSAAHVFKKQKQRRWEDQIVIALGVTLVPKPNSFFPGHVQLYQPERVIKHEKFNSNTFDYDVALIKVGKRLKVAGSKFAVDNSAIHGEITFDNFVRPVALPCTSACDVNGKDKTQHGISVREFKSAECIKYGNAIKSVANDLVVVTGYGDTTKITTSHRDLVVPDTLQQAPLKLLKSDRCVEGVKRIVQELENARFTQRMLCTGSDQGRDACQGDSGGPLIKKVTTETGDSCWVQIGIVSWGLGCANADKQNIPYPGYHADTSILMSWIVKNMGNN